MDWPQLSSCYTEGLHLQKWRAGLRKLLAGMDIPQLCTCQGHGKTCLLLPQNQARGKLLSFLICFLFLFPSCLSLPIFNFFSSFFLCFLQPHSSPGLYFFKSTFLALLCVQGQFGSITSDEVPASFGNFFGLPHASRKFSIAEGQQEPWCPPPHVRESKGSLLTKCCVALFEQGSLVPLQRGCPLMLAAWGRLCSSWPA